MKNNQKGFVIPLLIGIIVILILGGGIYIYSGKKAVAPVIMNSNLPVQTSTTTVQNTTSSLIPQIDSVAHVNNSLYYRITGERLSGSLVYFNSQLVQSPYVSDSMINFLIPSPEVNGSYPVYVQNSAGKSNVVYLKISDALPSSCTPNWTCGWAPCTNGYQGMTATDTNNCGLSSSGVQIACPALARVCSTTTDQTVNWKTYTNSTCGISFKYPPIFSLFEGRYGAIILQRATSTESSISLLVSSVSDVTSFPGYLVKYPILDANSGKPIQFQTRVLGSNTFYYSRLERFEGILEFGYYAVQNNNLYRFISNSTGVDWTNPNLDEENDSNHLALKQILSTLTFTPTSVTCNLINQGN